MSHDAIAQMARAWSADVAQLQTKLAAAVRERDEARAECDALHTAIENNDEELCTLTRERDESRAALARAQPVYDAAIAWERCYLTVAGNPSELELRQAVRSILTQTHTGKG